MGRMLRNLVGVKPDVRNDDLKRYVSVTDSIGTLGDQWERQRVGAYMTEAEFPARADGSGSKSSLAVVQISPTSALGIRSRAASVPIADRSMSLGVCCWHC